MDMLSDFLKALVKFGSRIFVATKYRAINSRMMLFGKLTVSFRTLSMPFCARTVLANSMDSFVMNGLKLQIEIVFLNLTHSFYSVKNDQFCFILQEKR
jgi:hypothetical protein